MIDYQRVWAEIDLDNIGSNIENIRKKLNKDTELMAIVKADGYGHGALEVSRVALFHGASCLGVAVSEEGVWLRKNNIYAPILILGYTPEPKLSEVILNNLTQTVFSFEMAKAISSLAVKLNQDINIHIKIDTGMSRLGFFPDEKTADEILKIKKLPMINITGMYTHFAVSDIEDKSFTILQYERLNYLKSLLSERNMEIPTHVSNSGAILDMREYDNDMVRAGIILYGLSPSDKVKFSDFSLKPAMSLKTRISHLKEVSKGVSVGYGRTYFTNKPTKIATIPVGYADGYSRSMSNKGRVLVNGEFAPVIGNVCMDQFMIDVSDIDNLYPGDEVVLFGKQKDKEISVNELAEIQNTINYEVVCSVGKRVPRVYMKNKALLKTVSSV